SAQGRAEEARRAYRDYAQRLAADLGIEPSAALRDVARQFGTRGLIEHRPADVPPKRAEGAGFVGRRVELARIKALLLGDKCRLLTVSGPGGVGKSALARAALPELAADFAGEAFWIALDDLSSTDQIAQRCASSIGLELRGADPPARQLTRHLRDLRALLVFDNAEHLDGFAAWVDMLLSDCGAIKLLITSRIRIGLASEWLLPLEGLPVPDADETELDALRAYDSVRLFEARAAAQHPSYDAAAEAVAAAAIARATEGLPLALELAAARVRILPVAEIGRELARSIDLLEPAADGAARNTSLRASFDHSFRMLALREREALVACTVFPAGFSREAARAIAGASLPLVASLVDKSLLRADGSGRFSLHSLIRQCAAERVEDASRLRLRHAEYFAHLLARHADFKHVDQKRAIAEVELELANCHAAWAVALAERSGRLIGLMAQAMRHFFEAAGRWTEGIELLSAALAVIDVANDASSPTRIAVLDALAALHWRRGDFARAEQHARAALALARGAEDSGGIKAALTTIGLSLWQMGRYEEARANYEEGLASARADGDREGVAQFSSNLAIIEKTEGNYARAAALYEEALAIERLAGNRRGLVTRLNNLGNLYRVQHDPAAAMRCFEEGLQLAEASGLAAPAVFLLVNLALTTLELGDLEACERYARRGLDQARLRGEPQIEVMAWLTRARLAIVRGEGASADEFTLEALVRAQATRYTLCELEAINVRAQALAARGDRMQAATLWSAVAGHPMSSADTREAAELGLARLTLTREEAAAAQVAAAGTSFEQIVGDTVNQLRAARP
ncbi:MAG: tetratricopeptide repeat protein, partial [Burkholderiales bacterium]|nr:tetratricopeptide repeat protein [Burkholderiales bacterium]